MNLRDLYVPIQPTVRQSAENVSYAEFLPDPRLQPYIYCYWELKTAAPLADEFCYRVVADGCVDIYFDLTNPAENYVMGICNQYTEFMLGNTFHYVGIRFLPTMFPQLFRVPASELSNRYQLLHDVVPDAAGYITVNFNGKLTIDTIIQKLDNYFIKQLNNASLDNDSRLYDAIDLILRNAGVLNLETSLDTGISPRQLRRLFLYYIGESPKTFCRIVRFQNILRAKPSNQSLKKNKLFFDHGFFDQAHFIKDFK
ncbi:MAG: AraC family transcriptional regulator, partial [Chitinophagaceae bacterium]